jgi:nicotinamide-nucleotide amidase
MAVLLPLSEQVGRALQARGWMLATAESCTGGGIAAAITDIAGSSAWFDRGFVTYSNEAKHDLLGVSIEVINHHGAVSEATVRAMAEGALTRSRARVSVAVSGIAGPGGGSADKPVGLVWFAWALQQNAGGNAPNTNNDASKHPSNGRFQVSSESRLFPGDRAAVRLAAVQFALEGVLARI